MRVDAFDFILPEALIALRPATPRDHARLLEVAPTAWHDRHVYDLPKLLRAGDALVFNDTKVIPAQLFGLKGQAKIGATLHKRAGDWAWWAFVRNARKLTVGDTIDFGHGLSASVEEKQSDGSLLLHFSSQNHPTLLEALHAHGVMPLPPYIANRRGADAQDVLDYQTVYAQHQGSVAAPTAGLHFTPALLAALNTAGVALHHLTLHVGAGTFLPVKAADTQEHRMHSEWGCLSEQTAAALAQTRARGGRVIAVGTTALRLLETAARATGRLEAFEGETDIFITPGFRFQAVDGLMTNFHLPRSTLFMLVAAFAGLERMHAAYAHAIAERYRFYSYGDSSLLWRCLPEGANP
jgi:S-adenosylmethionine:tRNA ribosyltransferase-isomerase